MKCKCKYYLMGADVIRRCSVCGKPAPSKDAKPEIEDKAVENLRDGVTVKDAIWAVNTEDDYHEER